jgi:hypothetical protein
MLFLARRAHREAHSAPHPHLCAGLTLTGTLAKIVKGTFKRAFDSLR